MILLSAFQWIYKVMIPGTKEHYMGKGPGNYVSNDGHDLKLLKKQKGGL